MSDTNDRTAATPPFEDAMPTIPDDAWKQPPLANAVTGVVRLRNGEEVPVLTTGCRIAPRDGSNRNWARHGGVYGDVEGRHPEDIVAQVSVGPTGPGVYELDGDGRVHLTGKDERGWRVHAKDPWYRDEFGRCFDDYGTRYATGDLRRRIGDLPEPGAVPAEVQEFAAAVERATEAAKSAEPYREACERMLAYVKETMVADGLQGVVFVDDDLPVLFTALAAAAGKRDETIPSPEPACRPPSYTADEGRAAMSAMWDWGVPTVHAAMRDWLTVNAVEAVTALASTHPAGRRGAAVLASVGGEATVQWFGAPVVVVLRDDLRVLYQGLCDAANMSGHFDEPDFGTISRAAAALGKTLPDWMREHARKEGWTCN